MTQKEIIEKLTGAPNELKKAKKIDGQSDTVRLLEDRITKHKLADQEPVKYKPVGKSVKRGKVIGG